VKIQNVPAAKTSAASIAVVGLLFQFVELFAPDYLVAEGSFAPEWVGWIAFGLTAVATIVYIWIDFSASHKR
jgi:hypothetical protein